MPKEDPMQPPMQSQMSIRSLRPVSRTSAISSSQTSPLQTKPGMRPLNQPVETKPPSPTRTLRLKLEQFKVKVQTLEKKRQQVLSPLYRQGIDAQLKILKQEIQKLTLALLLAQSQERLPLLEKLCIELAQSSPPFETLSEQWSTLYPAGLQIWPEPEYNQAFHSWSETIAEILRNLNGTTQLSFSFHLPEVCSLPAPAVSPQEQQYWLQLIQTLQQSSPHSENTEPFQLIDLSEAETAPIQSTTHLMQEEEKHRSPQDFTLQVHFDPAHQRVLLRNRMGMTLNPHKKTYQEYLDQGLTCIDQAVKSGFANTTPLQQAMDCFLEAISLNKKRYEAYFGLGYLYSLVRNLNHALYFLELAWKISHNPAIWAFIQQVKKSYGVS